MAPVRARGALRLEAALMGAAAMADMAADILRRTTTSGLGARLSGQWTGRGACVYKKSRAEMVPRYFGFEDCKKRRKARLDRCARDF